MAIKFKVNWAYSYLCCVTQNSYRDTESWSINESTLTCDTIQCDFTQSVRRMVSFIFLADVQYVGYLAEDRETEEVVVVTEGSEEHERFVSLGWQQNHNGITPLPLFFEQNMLRGSPAKSSPTLETCTFVWGRASSDWNQIVSGEHKYVNGFWQNGSKERDGMTRTEPELADGVQCIFFSQSHLLTISLLPIQTVPRQGSHE